jgi:hypothetical protein
MGLRRNPDRHGTVALRDEVDRFTHQPSSKTRTATSWRTDHASDSCGGVGLAGSENAQVPAETIPGIPGKEMVGLRVATVDIEVRALLLDDEYFASQAQQRIKFSRAELRKATPGVALG